MGTATKPRPDTDTDDATAPIVTVTIEDDGGDGMVWATADGGTAMLNLQGCGAGQYLLIDGVRTCIYSGGEG